MRRDVAQAAAQAAHDRVGMVKLHLRRSCRLHIAEREHAACVNSARCNSGMMSQCKGNACQIRISVGLVASG